MGPEQWLFLQWHEHKGSLVSMFEKLFERNTFVDCTLAAEGQYLNVHKVILSACSPYFELLLNENRDKHPIIILKDVKFRSLKSIIEYMYRGEANVLSSDIKDFLAAAESLQIKGIGKHGGDTKNQPKKALQDFVEGEGRSPHSPKIYPGSGDNDKRTVTDFHEIKSDDEDDESGRDKNFCYIENVEHHSNISPQKIPVPIITSETNAETQWLKAESPEDTAQYLMSMPTLNIGACTTDIVHPGLKETVPERTANKISTQNVLPCDVQMKKAEMSRSETKCELQPASPIVDNEVADSASQASSVRELSDTAEEWAEEEMEEALTHSHTTGNSVVGGTDESRAHFDGGSDATRESRDLGSDQQDCPGPERVVTISSDLLSALQIVLGIVPFIEEANRSGSRTDDVELRVLVHQSLAGSIIGKSGSRIQKLEELSGARVKLFSKCCPQSTERVCQVWGRPKSCVKALKEIIEIIKNGPYKGSNTPYDPHNFDIESIEDYGGYRESKLQESKYQEKKHFSGSDGSSPRKVNDDPVHQTDDDSGSKQESECEKNAFPKYVRSEKDKDIRFLIPSKTARAIIGKGGFNIKKLRREYRAIITIRDCPGPERILAITSDMDVTQQILHSILPTLEEASSNDDVDLRLLIHRSQAGSIIGKSGSKIQKLQENTGARVKLFPVCCPQSSERVCQIIGKRNAPVECFKEIIELLEGSPPKGHPIPYDPHNFDDYSAKDYGGFSESNKIRGSSVRDILKDERSRSSSRGRSSSPLSHRSHAGRSDDVRTFGRAHSSLGPIQNNELLKLLAQQEAEIQSLKKRILLTGI